MGPVKQAVDLYRTFQAKEPDHVTALDPAIQFPPRLGSAGLVKRLLYRSAKWRKDDGESFYIHDYETPVEYCEPWRTGLHPVRTPAWPREVVKLGDCIDLEVRAEEGGLFYPTVPKRTLLCATPDGRSLVLLHLKLGIVGALIGGRQRVTERGIEG